MERPHPEHERIVSGEEIMNPDINPDQYEALVLGAKTFNDEAFLGVGTQNIVLAAEHDKVLRINYKQARRALDPNSVATWDDAARSLQREIDLAGKLAEYFPDQMLPVEFEWQRVTFLPDLFDRALESIGETGKEDVGYTSPNSPITCNIPVGRQPLFTVPDGAEVLSLQTGKIDTRPVALYGESFSEQSTDPRGIYTRAAINELLCQPENGDFVGGWRPEEDESFIQAAYGAGKTLYLWEKAQADEHFRAAHKEFLKRCAHFTHETGEMVDLLGDDNIFAVQRENEAWDITMTDAAYPHSTNHELFIELVNTHTDPRGLSQQEKFNLLFFQNNALTYVRHVNLFSKAAGLDAPFDIRHANFDPNKERVIDEISWSQLCDFQQMSYEYIESMGMSPQDTIMPAGSYKSAVATL